MKSKWGGAVACLVGTKLAELEKMRGGFVFVVILQINEGEGGNG